MTILDNLNITELLTLNFFIDTIRYLVIALGSYLLFYRILVKRLELKTHNPKKIERKNVLREFLHSLRTIVVFIIPAYLLTVYSNGQIFKVYQKWDEYGVTWYWVSYLVTFFLHDTYFYWTHRLMHTKYLFRKFHFTHHRSIYPTPLASYAFSTGEALVEGMALVIVSLFVPLHVSVLLIFSVYSLIFNSYGHLGIDILPKRIQESFPFKYFNHPSNHGWHHRFNQGNFGLYLRFWDKVMGTWKGGLEK